MEYSETVCTKKGREVTVLCWRIKAAKNDKSLGQESQSTNPQSNHWPHYKAEVTISKSCHFFCLHTNPYSRMHTWCYQLCLLKQDACHLGWCVSTSRHSDRRRSCPFFLHYLRQTTPSLWDTLAQDPHTGPSVIPAKIIVLLVTSQ
jgi:hypothetical protein